MKHLFSLGRNSGERRRHVERRRRSRRRKNDQRSFVFELTQNDLRVAVLDRSAAGNDRATASVAAWRREASSLRTPAGLVELTAAFRTAVAQHNMAGADVRIVLSGEYCILRVVRGATEAVRSELGRLEQRSRLYLSLGPGEKVLVSHSRSIDARHTDATAAACNRATLETIQQAADAAGIEVTNIEPSLSALTRAVNRLQDVPTEPYLLVEVDDGSVEIGVCHEGRLLLDYRPGGRREPADLASLLESHLNRLNRHVARTLRTNASLKHVFICGEGKAADAALRTFRQRRSPLNVRRVGPSDVQATWKLEDEAIDSLTATALGGLLASYLPPDQIDAPNLMEHILESQLEPLQPTVLRSLAPIAAACLLAAGLHLANARQQQMLDDVSAELGGVAKIAARANELRLQATAAEEKVAQLTILAQQLPGQTGGDLVRRIGACMPGDVWLTRLELVNGTQARLSGASFLESGIFDFVRWLQQAPSIREAAIRRTNAAASAAGPVIAFDLDVTFGPTDHPTAKVARHE